MGRRRPRPRILTTVVVLALAIIVTGLGAATVSPAIRVDRAGAAMAEKPLCIAPGDQTSPKVWGNWVVWQNGSSGMIEKYNLSNPIEKNCGSTIAGGGYPDIWQDEVVYARGGQVRIYNLTSASESTLPTGVIDAKGPFSIDRNIIVWEDWRGGSPHIWGFNLTNNTEWRISTLATTAQDPNVWGNHVGWTDVNGNVLGYRISTGSTFPVASSGFIERSARIYGTRLFYAYDGSPGELRYYNLTTAATTTLLTNPGSFGVFGAWKDTVAISRADGNVYLYNATADKEVTVAIGPDDQTNADIWENRIVWQDRRNGVDYDIFVNDNVIVPEFRGSVVAVVLIAVLMAVASTWRHWRRRQPVERVRQTCAGSWLHRTET